VDRRELALTQLPPMELAIMHVLWDNGPSTVQEVQDHLKGGPAYTTVQTVLNTMERKGRVKRKLTGKAYIYRSALSKDATLGNAVRDLVQRTFQGSVEGLLLNMVKTEQIDEETIERLSRLLAEQEPHK
jgi:predicted transcriptional regulator